MTGQRSAGDGGAAGGGSTPLFPEKPDEQGSGSQRMIVGAAAVSHTAMCLELRRARREPRKHVMLGEPNCSHPIRPTGKGTECRIDSDRTIAVAMQPIGKAVDVVGGRTGAEPLPRDR